MFSYVPGWLSGRVAGWVGTWMCGCIDGSVPGWVGG